MRKSFLRGASLMAALALSLGACQDSTTGLDGPGADPGLASAPDLGAARQGGNASREPRIAFAVLGAGIHTMNADGTGYAAVPNTPGGTDPAWSPDRRKLAYAVTSGAEPGIYVITPKGTRRKQLYAGPAWAPAWSPDGRRIAFHAAVAGATHLFLMDADGSNVRPLTAVGTNRDPAWSPDGSRIAFFSDRLEGPGIWVMDADGTNGARIVSCLNCAGPAWSPVPGADLIVFSFFEDDIEGHSGIGVVKADGSNPSPIPDVLAYSSAHGTNDVQPSWSPDGTRLVFSSAMLAGGTELFAVDATAQSEPQRLTTTLVLESAPAWAR